jgi:hypothetical protein
MKIECSRFNEVEAIEHAHGLSRQTYRQVEGSSPELKYPFIKHRDHIPETHGWRDFDHLDTSLTGIRLSMGLRTKEDLDNELTKGDAGTNGKEGEMLVASESNTSVRRSRRVLRVIISTRYFPITKLEPQQFWTAWEQCYSCESLCRSPCPYVVLTCLIGHYDLWRRGIHHGDISMHNLMVTEDGKLGVLNDFDLVRCAKLQPISKNQDRTGTIPFMALDLLTNEYWSGLIEREYRHDQESFIWILAYYFLRSSKGMYGPITWHTHDWNACRLRKNDFLATIQKYSPIEPAYQDHWKVVMEPLDQLKDRVDSEAKAKRALARGKSVPPQTIYSNKDRFFSLAASIRESLGAVFGDSDIFASTAAQVGDDEELLDEDMLV